MESETKLSAKLAIANSIDVRCDTFGTHSFELLAMQATSYSDKTTSKELWNAVKVQVRKRSKPEQNNH